MKTLDLWHVHYRVTTNRSLPLDYAQYLFLKMKTKRAQHAWECYQIKNVSTKSIDSPSYSPLELQDSQAPEKMQPGATSWRIQNIHSNAPCEHRPDHKIPRTMRGAERRRKLDIFAVSTNVDYGAASYRVGVSLNVIPKTFIIRIREPPKTTTSP